jgi:hypothetical protein
LTFCFVFQVQRMLEAFRAPFKPASTALPNNVMIGTLDVRRPVEALDAVAADNTELV